MGKSRFTAQMELPDDVKVQLKQFSGKIDDLQAAAKSTCSTVVASNLQEGNPNSDIDRAKCYLMMARHIHEAMILYSQASGKEPPASLTKDKEKLEVFARKVAKAESAEILKKGRPEHLGRIDIAAANRFISNSIPELTSEQKNRLRDISTSIKKATEGQGAGIKEKAKSGGKRKKVQEDDDEKADPQKKAALDFLNSL